MTKQTKARSASARKPAGAKTKVEAVASMGSMFIDAMKDVSSVLGTLVQVMEARLPAPPPVTAAEPVTEPTEPARPKWLTHDVIGYSLEATAYPSVDSDQCDAEGLIELLYLTEPEYRSARHHIACIRGLVPEETDAPTIVWPKFGHANA